MLVRLRNRGFFAASIEAYGPVPPAVASSSAAPAAAAPTASTNAATESTVPVSGEENTAAAVTVRHYAPATDDDFPTGNNIHHDTVARPCHRRSVLLAGDCRNISLAESVRCGGEFGQQWIGSGD